MLLFPPQIFQKYFFSLSLFVIVFQNNSFGEVFYFYMFYIMTLKGVAKLCVITHNLKLLNTLCQKSSIWSLYNLNEVQEYVPLLHCL